MRKALLLFAVVMLSVMTASATLIDHFSAPPSAGQFVCLPGYAGCTGSTSTIGGGLTQVLGGARTITISDPSPGGANDAFGGANLPATPDLLALNTTTDYDGRLAVTWTPGNMSVLGGGETLLHLVYKTDAPTHGFTLSVELNGFTVNQTVTGSTSLTDLFIPLSAFTPTWQTSFTSLATASMTINTAGREGTDMYIHLLETTTPEPMTFAMMGLGLVAIGALRLRKK